MLTKPKPKMVELVNTSYQPTKVEKESPVALNVPGDTIEEQMESIGKALMQPVKIRWIDKPRNRR